jgi:hypothetical protein
MSRMSGGRNGSISSASFQQIPSAADRHAKLKALADDAVTEAVDEAIAHCRYPTAYALRTLYDEKCHDPDFVSLVVRIFRQQADAEDLEDFGRLFASRKREGKREDKGHDYFEPPSSDRRLAPHKPKPAPYRHLVKMDLTILHQNTKPEQHIIKADHGEQPSASAPAPAPTPAPAPESEATASPTPSLPPRFSPEPAPVPESEPAPQPEPVHPPSPSPAPSPAPSPTPEPPAVAPEPPVVAPQPSPPPQQSTKRELPQDDEAQGEPEVDAHVRKKRRSNRHSGGTRTMANGVHGKPKTATPSKRRTRGTSQSSTSSLSSAQSVTPPASIQPDDADEELPDASPSRQSPTPEERPASPVAEEVSSSLPILKASSRKGRRSVATRKSINGNVAAVKRSGRASKSTSTTPATSKQPTPAPLEIDDASPPGRPFEMPEPLNEPLYPHHANLKRGGKGANGGIAPPSKVGRLDDSDEKWRLRKSARAITNSYRAEGSDELSFVRPAPEPQPQPGQEQDQEREPAEATTPPPRPSSRARTSLPTVRPGTTAANARSTRSSRKRSHDDPEEQPSPTTLNFGPPEAGPGTAATSRAGTPVLRPAKKPRTGLRVKNS